MSKTIDERVVEMRFNNQQFEKNAQTSISTLGKLKESLNLSGASKGLDDISKAAKNVQLDGIASGVDALQRRFSTLGIVGMRVIENITDSVTRLLAKPFSFLKSGIVEGGITRAMNLENAHFQLQGLLKDEEAVSAVMKNVNDAVDGTAYSLDAAAKVASQLAASGMTAGDEMFTSLRAVAGVAAMTNSSYEDIGRIFTQVAGQGRLMGDQLLQLSGRGMNAAAVLGEALGKSEAEIRDMVSKGKIDFQTFAKAMDDAFGEHAKKANETLTGSLSNVKSALGRIGALFVSPLVVQNGPIVKFFNALRERLNEVKNNIGPLADLFVNSVTKMADAATNFVKNLDFTYNFKTLNNLVEIIKNLGRIGSSLLSPIKEAFKDIFPYNMSEQIFKLSEGFKNFTANAKIMSSTSDKIKRTFKGLFSSFEIFRKLLTLVAKAVGGIFKGGGVSGVIDLLLSFSAAIGDFFTSLNSGFKIDGVGKSISKVTSGISGVVKNAANALDVFGGTFDKVVNGISKAVGHIWEAFDTFFSWITDHVSIGDVFAGLLGANVFILIEKFKIALFRLKWYIRRNLGPSGLGTKDIVTRASYALGSLNKALIAFRQGINAGTLLTIAAAVGILAMAMKSIADLDIPDITKALFSIGALMTMLTFGFKSVNKTLSKFQPKGIVKAGISMIFLAKAIDILAGAMEKIGSLNFKTLVKGLVGVGGGMLALTKGLKAIDKVQINIRTSIAMLALAQSCKMLGDALSKFGTMKFSEISKGLIGMGGALGEMMLIFKGMDKISGGKSILGSMALLIAVQSLSTLANSLKKFGSMSWKEIRHGLVSMGGALAEIVKVTNVISKFGGFSSIFGAVSINIVVSSLSELSDGLEKFGSMKWSEIGKGLTAMGGALIEVAGVSGALGKIAGFSGIFGGGAILMTVQGLDELAEAMKKFGSMAWKEIAKGLVGMGGALLEVAGVSGALGKIAGFSGMFGSGSLAIVMNGIGKLADAFVKFGEMSWSEIGKGLTAMGGALLEVGGITGALGYLTNFAGIIGGASIWVAVQGLGDLADAFKKFGEMSWDEIKQGLAAMGGALGELAVGGFLNTFSIIGSLSIDLVAESLGVLADSVKKWSDVKVPADIGTNLASLAGGVLMFSLDGLGALSIATVAEPLGILADSVKKWAGVTVPENLNSSLASLSEGVKSFTWAFTGGWSMSAVVGPLGNLAGDVKKWSGVSVPDTLKTSLTNLSAGVKSFTWAFTGGWSMSAVVGPLGDMAGAVKKWSGVSVSDDLKSSLTTLSAGIKSFTWAYLGSVTLDALVEPLGKLADSVKKWEGVTIPEGMGDDLKELAGGIKAFKAFNSGSITTVTDGFATVASSISKLSHVNFNSVADGLSSFGDAMNDLKDDADNIGSIGTSIVNNLINPIKNSSSKLASAGKTMMNALTKGIASKQKSIETTMANSVAKAASGMSKNSGKIKSSMSKSLSSVVTSIRGYYTNFYNAGSYLVKGFANGISANTFKAAAKARAMASAAKQAAKDELKEKSPSKEGYEIGDYFGIGFVNGIGNNVHTAFSVGAEMAKSAKNGLNATVDKLRKLIDTDMNLEPTIKPMLDLSNIKSGAGSIGSMIGNPSLEVMSNVGSISRMMNRQNGANDDVVSALNKLRGDLGNIGGDTYIVNGLTYDDGTNVSDAVRTLVRAAKIERRR